MLCIGSAECLTQLNSKRDVDASFEGATGVRAPAVVDPECDGEGEHRLHERCGRGALRASGGRLRPQAGY